MEEYFNKYSDFLSRSYTETQFDWFTILLVIYYLYLTLILLSGTPFEIFLILSIAFLLIFGFTYRCILCNVIIILTWVALRQMMNEGVFLFFNY